MSAWNPVPNTNVVLEALQRLTRGGEIPVSELDVLSYLRRQGYSVSRGDLSKILLTLETLGYIIVFSSTKEERLIKLSPK